MIEVIKEAISKEAVDTWYEQWEAQRELIHAAHDRRDKTVTQLMEAGIEHFEQFLLAASEGNATIDSSAEYELLPINGMERLQFVKLRPGQYACYRQLDELYKETKKRCARLRLKK